MRRSWIVLPMVLLALAISGVLSGVGPMAPVEAAGVEIVTPIQRGLNGVSRLVSQVIGSLGRLGYLEEENNQLKIEVESLKSRMAALQETDEENQRLRGLLGYKRDHSDTEYMVAGVLGRGQNNLTRSIILNKGARDSVKRGSVVVAPSGLVGRVTQVHPNASRVLLITDPSSGVNGIITRSSAEGVVTGRLGSGLFMEFVKSDAAVQVGDVVMTSGLGGRFPRGLVIGQVSDVVSKDLYLFKEVHIRPATDVDSLREVMIVLDFSAIQIPGDGQGQAR